MPKNLEQRTRVTLPEFFNSKNVQRFPIQGGIIYAKDTSVSSRTLYFVLTGGVALETSLPQGRSTSSTFLRPGDFFGFEDWGEQSRSTTARATRDDTKVAFIDLSDDQLYGEENEIIRNTVLAAMVKRVEDLTTTVAVNKRGNFLHRVARELQRRAINDQIDATAGAMADNLGLSRQGVASELSKLSRRGVVVASSRQQGGKYKYNILDQETLTEILTPKTIVGKGGLEPPRS